MLSLKNATHKAMQSIMVKIKEFRYGKLGALYRVSGLKWQ